MHPTSPRLRIPLGILPLLALLAGSGIGTARADAADPGATTASVFDPRKLTAIEYGRRPAAQVAPFATDTDAEVRAKAARTLGRLRDGDALPLLRSLAADPDVTVRTEAAFALGQTPGASQAIGDRLTGRAPQAVEPDEAVRVRLLLALGLIGEKGEVALVTRSLQGGTRKEAVAAAEALGNLGQRKVEGASSPETLQALLSAFERWDPDLHRAAAFALGRSVTIPFTGTDETRFLSVLFAEPDAVARAFLVRAAASGLEQAAWDGAVARLADDDAPSVRIALLRAMGRRGSPMDASWMVRLASDGERTVRLTAMDTIAAADPNPAFLHVLRAGTKDPDPEVRASAVVGLYRADQLDEPRAWLAPDVHPLIRQRLVEAWKDEDILLQMAFEDGNSSIRTAAVLGLLERDPPPAMDRILRLLEHPDAILAAGAASFLADHPHPDAEGALVSALEKDRDRELDLACLQALAALYEQVTARGRRPDMRVGRLLSDFQNHPDRAVREAARAVREAARLPPPPPLPAPQDVTGPPDVLAATGARIRTDKGEFIIEFDGDDAPYTVAHWVSLAETGFFDGLVFHRVVPDFVVQGGDPRGDGWGGAGHPIPDELGPLPFDRFTVGMALSGPDTGSSQWFVTLSPQPHLTGRYTRFGRVVRGEDVLRRLQIGDRILDVTVERVPSPPAAAATTSPP